MTTTEAPEQVAARAQLRRELAARQRSATAAARLSDDGLRSVRGARTVLRALWPEALPQDCGCADWWRTPLGRLVAAAVAPALADRAVTHAVAADILGVQRSSISGLLAKGSLARAAHSGAVQGGEGAGVSLASVLARVAR